MTAMSRRVAATFGTGLVLAAVAAASITLNTDFQSAPRFDGAGYSVLGERWHPAGATARSTSRMRPACAFSPGIRRLWL